MSGEEEDALRRLLVRKLGRLDRGSREEVANELRGLSERLPMPGGCAEVGVRLARLVCGLIKGAGDDAA